MKFILINPPIYDFSAYDVWIKPLGLLYISNILKSLGNEVVLFDFLDRNYQEVLPAKPDGTGKFYSQKVEKPEVLKNIPLNYKRYGAKQYLFTEFLQIHKDADYIIISSTMTYWYYGIVEVLTMIKEILPKTKIILGGTYPILMPQHSKKMFSSYVEHIFHTADVTSLITYIFNSTVKKSEIKKYKNFKNFPLPDYTHYTNLPYVVIRTSYGCVYNCSYCSCRRIEKYYTIKPLKNIIEEIKTLYFLTKSKNFVFYDDMLFTNTKYTKKFLTGLYQISLPVKFFTPNGLNPKYISKDIANLMKKTNFIDPRLSLETTDDSLHKKFDKKVYLKEFLTAVENLLSAGYRPEEISVYILAGLPQQKIENLYHTVEFLAKLKFRIRLCELSPVPGSKLFYELGLDESIDPLLHNNSIFLFNGIPGKVNSWCSYNEFQELKHYIQMLNRVV